MFENFQNRKKNDFVSSKESISSTFCWQFLPTLIDKNLSNVCYTKGGVINKTDANLSQ